MSHGIAAQGLFFCPWCGTNLAESLLAEWFELARSLGLDRYVDIFSMHDVELPPELATDKWWRDRGM